MTSMRRTVLEWALVVLIAAALTWAAAVALTGGFTLAAGPVRVPSHDVLRPLALAVILFVALSVRFRPRAMACLAIVDVIRRAAVWITLAIAVVVGVTAVKYASFAATGADPYGYVSQAYWWLDGHLAEPEPLVDAFSWRHTERSLAPLGYRPSPDGRHIVPIYSPGLPMMMAIAAAIAGACGPFLVVPVLSGVLVLASYALGRRAAGALVGLAAAILVAASPAVLFQAIWPMSDVPAAAVWTLAVVIALGPGVRAAMLAGGVAAIGLLVRPNLVFVPAAMAVALLVASGWRRAVAFAAGVAPAAAIIAALNTIWYGAPWKSGYGSLQSLYGFEHLGANLRGYLGALWHSQTPFIFLCVLPLAGVASRRVDHQTRWVLGALIASMWFSYVFYLHFEEWWYLRFLLPAFPAMIVLAVAAAAALIRRLPAHWSALAGAVLVIAVMSAQLQFIRGLGVLIPMRAAEHRYIDVARYVDGALPKNAAILAMQHSGSLRFYSGRLTIRWDWLNESTLPGAPRAIRSEGFHPYAVLEDWELPEVRKRLGLAKDAPLPWPVIARMVSPVGVSVYDADPHLGRSRITPVTIQATHERYCIRPRAPLWK